MSHQVFIDNDNKYLQWISSNPNGFVINTTRTKRLAYRVLHTASCRHVTKPQPVENHGAYTARDYIKICANRVEDLRAWTRSEGEASGNFSQECASCKPWSSEAYDQATDTKPSQKLAQTSTLVSTQAKPVEIEKVISPTQPTNKDFTGKADFKRSDLDLSLEQIKQLHDKYLELVEFEVKRFGVKPTEVRHLIGRLGEFYCALTVNGTMSHVVNQHGFDVLGPTGRRISVKTTAQKTGFVRISAKTLDQVDDLMVIQFRNDRLDEVYFGEVTTAISHARYYESVNAFELDISKARALADGLIPA
ncbi:TPA: hypothetical protein O4G41_004542 [Vibrio alginolyticus]|nr:hypothetical protein [Vibrio alginolyticus]HCZ9302738.1 hypothetical protein [Vibrio alginolyticus]